MANFPIFERLDIENYELFPGGDDGKEGLHIQFLPGLLLVLGANGLGKTTLVTMLYRLLTGPYDILAINSSTELGTVKLSSSPLPSQRRRHFAERVTDSGQRATARVQLRFGESKVVITRKLEDLSLVRLEVEGEQSPIVDEEDFQQKIIELVGVWSFGDWILLLRYLVFYFEDRKALVWDPTAQRQLLRALLLQSSDAERWTLSEREVLKLDSDVRNTGAVLHRREKALSKNDTKEANSDGLREVLATLTQMQEADLARNERLRVSLVEIESGRIEARRAQMQAEDDYESCLRGYEHAKLSALHARFPTQDVTARYILSHMVTTGDCLVCGEHVPDFANLLDKRISEKKCLLCSSPCVESPQDEATDIHELRISKAKSALSEAEAVLRKTKYEFNYLSKDVDNITTELHKIQTEMDHRRVEIDSIFNRLPLKGAELSRQRTELQGLRSSYESEKVQLASMRKSFSDDMEIWKRHFATRAEEIITSFQEYADEFLLEECRLSWAPTLAPLGQTGMRIEFPAFALDMKGGSFTSSVRRVGPTQVSESQKEFIDLAFRMALMAVAGAGGASLVVDAPESSLDAIFVQKAANVFARFAEPERDNRLLITSNLIDGKYIPSLLETMDADEKQRRVVNLFNIAVPTTAVQQFSAEYQAYFVRLLSDELTNEASS
ncbi:MAG: AAA family ATPase [Desulfovibrio sp.]